MPDLYRAIHPVRAEQYRPGMTSILGRAIHEGNGGASFYPHTLRCGLADGCWVVEVGPRIILKNGVPTRDGTDLRVLDDAEFRATYDLDRRMVRPTG